MSAGLKLADFQTIFAQLASTFREQRDALIELDSAIGDGDLGLTMERGFTAAQERSDDYAQADLGAYFRTIGMGFVSKAPSTMGTLMGSGFMAAGKALANCETFGSEQLLLFFSSFAEAIATRGKVSRGDKTAYDVLASVTDHLRNHQQHALEQATSELRTVARQSCDDVKKLKSKHGKAAVFQEKTIGLPDPGAEACTLFIITFGKGILSCLHAQESPKKESI